LTDPMKKLENMIKLCKYYCSFLSYDLIKVYSTNPQETTSSTIDHLKAAVQWMCRAQDAFNDGGVARSYSLLYNPYFKCKGWIPSYPETTGYIIPTMFDYSHLVKSEEIYDRAIRMADWEYEVQMENGAVQGGTIDQKPTPVIFNTGQVIFGWLRAFQETEKEKYLNCATKAGNFLVERQDRDGAWKSLSLYAGSHTSFRTYNTRTAWALLLLSLFKDNAVFKEASIRNIEFSLGQRLDNGWFKSNCVHDPSQPLLHTIAYCVRGVLEVGVILNNQNYINSARKVGDILIEKQRDDGSLSGCFDERWETTVSWSCLTGDAQISIIWGRLFQITGEPKYFECMKKINRYLMKCQLISTNNKDLFGGITGSDPIQGAYGPLEILSWAVKFFMDALMLEMSIQSNMQSDGEAGTTFDV